MLIATQAGLFSLDATDETSQQILDGAFKLLAAGPTTASAARPDGEVFRLQAGTARSLGRPVEEPLESLCLLSETPFALLLGTEGPYLYRLDEAGTERLEGFATLECREKWYTPWGGPAAVRSLATDGDWIYADIHVGSIMRSPDSGCHWEPVTPDLHEDVHQVATAPAAPGRLYANTADAVFVSEDRGDSWQRRAEGLSARYGRAIAVHPDRPERLLASVSNGPHGDAAGKLFFSDDAGNNWHHISDGFPAFIPGNIDTFQLAFDRTGTAWVAVEKDLYRSADGRRWEKAWIAPGRIAALADASF